MATGSENFLSLVRQAYRGELKLPAFQRDFKWNRKQVVLLYDSIRQSYPLGSVIFLEGSKTELSEREFKGAEEGAAKNDTKRLVLDGQQRLTAGIDLFYGKSKETRSQYFIDLEKLDSAVKEAGLNIEDDEEVQRFLRDLDAEAGYCVAKARVDEPFSLLSKKHLLSTVLLRPDNSKERDYWLEKYEDDHPNKKALIRNLVKPYLVVNEAPDIPHVSIDSKLQLDAISRIFATLNSTGKVLTPFELVVAVLYSANIDLKDDLGVLRELFPTFNQMDKTGEICLQTVVMLNGGDHKKSLLPKNLKPDEWEKDKDRAGTLLNQVGEFLTEQMGMALDKTSTLIPYDSIFAPLAIVFDRIAYAKLKPADKAGVHSKIIKWVAGAALTQRYQEGVHTKQSRDAKEIIAWIQNNDSGYEPTWLAEATIPALRSVTPKGAIANLLKCLVNRENLKDPLTGATVNFGVADTHAHHIFPKKYVEKLDNWNAETGDKVDLALNLMQLSAETNSRFLNDDPRQQVLDSRKSNGSNYISAYERQGIQGAALVILEKESKTRDDYWNFIKLRETYFENRLKQIGFQNKTDEEINDDLEEA